MKNCWNLEKIYKNDTEVQAAVSYIESLLKNISSLKENPLELKACAPSGANSLLATLQNASKSAGFKLTCSAISFAIFSQRSRSSETIARSRPTRP